VARRAAVEAEVTSILRVFHCDVCDKQFKTVAQYDEHTNSYAHHHKIRFRDMQAAQRAKQNSQEAVDARREKERRREEKELRKIAKAAGVKMTKPGATSSPMASVAAATSPAEGLASAAVHVVEEEPQINEWATVKTTAGPAQPRVGWPSTRQPSQLTSTEPSAIHTQSGRSPYCASSLVVLNVPTAVQNVHESTTTPSASQIFQIGPPSDLSQTDPQSAMPLPTTHLVTPVPNSSQLASTASILPGIVQPPANTSAPPKKLSKKAKDEAREKSRSGWQSFQRGGKR